VDLRGLGWFQVVVSGFEWFLMILGGDVWYIEAVRVVMMVFGGFWWRVVSGGIVSVWVILEGFRSMSNKAISSRFVWWW
jgi:hypothetical protein